MFTKKTVVAQRHYSQLQRWLGQRIAGLFENSLATITVEIILIGCNYGSHMAMEKYWSTSPVFNILESIFEVRFNPTHHGARAQQTGNGRLLLPTWITQLQSHSSAGAAGLRGLTVSQ